MTPAPSPPAAEYVDPRVLVPWPDNPRANAAAVRPVAESIRQFGFAAPIVARAADRMIIAGHTRHAAALLLKLERVPVRFVDVDDGQARALALADNRTGEIAGWDDAGLARVLTDLARDGVAVDGLGWTGAELRNIIAAAGTPPSPTGAPSHEDDAPPPPAVPSSIPGTVYRLGRHVIVCGDSHAPDVWAVALDGRRPAMVWCDPPYGMGLETDYATIGHGQGRTHPPVIGDDRPYDPAPFLSAIGHDVAEQFWFGADYYCERIQGGGSWLVWDKRTSGDGAAYDDLFGASFELCWSRRPHKREMIRILWAMSHGRESDDMRFAHPTQKPVALARWFIDRFTTPGDVVVDGYAGSGTLLVAAELSGRAAAVVEVSPGYCDVIRARYDAIRRAAPRTR